MSFTILEYGWFCLMLLPIVATLLPFVKHDHWVFRIFDFPRLQIAVANLICPPIGMAFAHAHHQVFWLIAIVNGLCFLYQVSQIIVYTRLYPPKVHSYYGADDSRTLSLLTANVLTHNHQAHLLLNQIHQLQPDIVLTLESDEWWQSQLDTLMDCGYHHTVKIPLDNLYGMHLYSRLELADSEIRHWVTDDIPSIKSRLKLRSNDWVYIYCLHPMPPSPTESATATDRDAELLLVGREIEFMNEPVLVFGDLNDVAWSSTSKLFQKISGLLDPRKGRGLFNTFHANYPLLRWPLDHIFHSRDFMVKDIQVLPNIGSDHFPVYGKFQYQPNNAQPTEPTPSSDDIHETLDKIAKNNPNQEVIKTKY